MSPIEIRRSAFTVVVRIVVLEVVFMSINLLFHIGNGLYEYSNGIELFNTVFSDAIFFLITMLLRLIFIAKIVYDWTYSYWTIEEETITYHTGLFRQHTEEYSKSNIESVSIHQTLLGKLLNFGSLELTFPILNKSVVLDSVPYPQLMSRLIGKSGQTQKSDTKILFRNQI